MARILIVEDSRTQAQELKSTLQSGGFDVERAADAEAGIELLGQSAFDLVISDVVMPGMSGYELCRWIKADPPRKHTPVILLTSLSDAIDAMEGLECGADSFLSKPYAASDLLTRVASVLERRKLRRTGSDAGSEVVFLGRKFVITSDREQILGLLLSTFEETVRRNKELLRSQAELATLLNKLELAHQELEAFSYSVSHDLRAPLRSIDGFSQALVEDYGEGLEAPAQEYLRRIRGAVERMSELIDDLLQLALVTRAELRSDQVDLSRIARSVIAQLKQAEPDRHLEVQVEDGLVCRGDEKLLRIAVENLLGNAFKFTSKVPAPRIEMGSKHERGQPAFYVADNGAGFDATYAAKLFKPFQRLHNREDFPGTGIGLAIVNRIVRRHGGRVWAEGEVGRGATFRFTLDPGS